MWTAAPAAQRRVGRTRPCDSPSPGPVDLPAPSVGHFLTTVRRSWCVFSTYQHYHGVGLSKTFCQLFSGFSSFSQYSTGPGLFQHLLALRKLMAHRLNISHCFPAAQATKCGADKMPAPHQHTRLGSEWPLRRAERLGHIVEGRACPRANRADGRQTDNHNQGQHHSVLDCRGTIL